MRLQRVRFGEAVAIASLQDRFFDVTKRHDFIIRLQDGLIWMRHADRTVLVPLTNVAYMEPFNEDFDPIPEAPRAPEARSKKGPKA